MSDTRSKYHCVMGTSDMKVICSVALVLLLYSNVSGVTVKTKYGAVKGQSHTLHNGKQVNSFLGIPFAKPPIGELRWRAPEEPEPWVGTFKASKLRSACLQQNKIVINITHGDWTDYSEDCLHLNIYTPKDITRRRYPVLFVIYGGGFTSGSNFIIPGYFLPSQDIVVVITNYRLNTLGFASTGDSVSPGNYGLLDQQLALRFVRDNIKAFGGDPNKVTIIGQSAGGASVGYHTIAPSSKGLFHQAIYQSGTDLSYWALHSEVFKPWTYIQQLAEIMNCTTSDNKQMMDCLRSKPGKDLNEFVPIGSPGHICTGFGPVVDGQFLPAEPIVLRNSSTFTRVPTMMGIMEKDNSFALLFAYPDGNISKGLTYQEFEDSLLKDISKVMVGKEYLIEDIYNAFKFFYTAWGEKDNLATNRDKLIYASTDLSFGFGSDLVLRDISSHSVPAFSYVMKYFSKNARIRWMGPTHGGDIVYVYGMNYLPRNPSVLKESGFRPNLRNYTEEDDKMADFMMTMVANFVKNGHPTPTPIAAPSGGPISWRPYTERTRESLMINLEPKHESRYRQQAYALFREYLPYLVTKKRL